MNDAKLNALMQLVPERYLDEAMDYHAAHAPQEIPVQAEQKAVPHRMLWIAAPVSAAACLAAVTGLVLFIGTKQPEHPVESLQNAIIEEQPPAGTVTTAAETVTTAAGTVTQRSTVAKPHTDAESAAVTVTAIVSGSAAQTATSAEPAESSAGTAKASSAAAAHTEDAAQTETEPLPTIAGRPYDPEIVAQYQLGDVDMDGEIRVEDCQLMWREYNTVVRDGGESILTAEQLVLADIVKDNRVPLAKFNLATVSESNAIQLLEQPDYPVSFTDVMIVLAYYSGIPAHRNLSRITMEEFAQSGIFTSDGNGNTVVYHGIDWRYVDAAEETVTIPEFGTLPVQVGAFTMFGYRYCPEQGESSLFYRDENRLIELTRSSRNDDGEPRWVASDDPGIEPPSPDILIRSYYPAKYNSYNFNSELSWYESGINLHTYGVGFASEEDFIEASKQFMGIRIPNA